MYYYRYDERYIIIEKSEKELTGYNVAHASENFDLDLYDVTIGFLSEANEILRDTKKLRGADAIARQLNTISEHNVDMEIDIDFRLSLLELGLA
jgi:hypothetical protein